jgi:hypothetical protein
MTTQLPRRHVIIAVVALVLQLILLHALTSTRPAHPATPPETGTVAP